MMQDITAQKQREHEERQRQEEIIEQQQATLAELSTPLLTISDTTVVMPLVGAVDSLRVAQMMDTLLNGVSASRASTVILDITGVSIVDTQVANAFIRASQAVSLLGAQVVLTGIRPEVAQTLVGLGVDLRGIITRSTLRDGITYALQH
jgi:rsbT co-antagonist protein RsbR